MDMSSYLVEELYHENHLSKYIQQDSRCNHSLLLSIKLEKTLENFGIFQRIFHVSQNQCQQFKSITTVNQQMVGHNIYTGKSRHIYCRRDTAKNLLSNRIISIDHVNLKEIQRICQLKIYQESLCIIHHSSREMSII